MDGQPPTIGILVAKDGTCRPRVEPDGAYEMLPGTWSEIVFLIFFLFRFDFGILARFRNVEKYTDETRRDIEDKRRCCGGKNVGKNEQMVQPRAS